MGATISLSFLFTASFSRLPLYTYCFSHVCKGLTSSKLADTNNIPFLLPASRTTMDLSLVVVAAPLVQGTAAAAVVVASPLVQETTSAVAEGAVLAPDHPPSFKEVCVPAPINDIRETVVDDHQAGSVGEWPEGNTRGCQHVVVRHALHGVIGKMTVDWVRFRVYSVTLRANPAYCSLNEKNLPQVQATSARPIDV